jgi:uncharacterized protein (DUF849 family)
MGSINFGLYHLLPKYEKFKFDWEKAHLEATRDLVFRNSFSSLCATPAQASARFTSAVCSSRSTRRSPNT